MKSCKDHLTLISKLAADKWGEDWELSITKEYAKIRQGLGEETATTNSRRNQIRRAFEVGSCTADTLITLYHAVNCELEISCKKLITIP